MRIIQLAAITVLCAACAQDPPVQTAAISTPVPAVVVVEKQVVVEKPVIVEKPVVVTKPVVVEKRLAVKKKATPVSGSRCTYVKPYTRKDGTRVSGHTRCRK